MQARDVRWWKQCLEGFILRVSNGVAGLSAARGRPKQYRPFHPQNFLAKI